MPDLTTDQLTAALAYVQQENAQLRAENLLLRVRSGDIRLVAPTPEAAGVETEAQNG